MERICVQEFTRAPCSIRVMQETLSDGSKVFDVVAASETREVVLVHATCEGAACVCATAIYNQLVRAGG